MGLIAGESARVKCSPSPTRWYAAPKPCDYCNSAEARIFCQADSAFMCIDCDAKVHNADADTAAMMHGKLWICEVCEQAPAAVACKADDAALCDTCDRDIHSANPLAQRHERTALVPFYDTVESMMFKSTAAIFAAPQTESIHDRKLDDSTNSHVHTTLPPATETPEMKSMEFILSDIDSYQICSQPYGDRVVPVQTTVKPPVSAQLPHQHCPENRFEIDFTKSNITSYITASLSHSVSSSSMDVGVVPDGSASVSETSNPFTMSSISDHGSQAAEMDRKARVLRYREKRKHRKFEKTIRYASRKAYAEARPRFKGRFAKSDG